VLAGSRPDPLAAELPNQGHGAFAYAVL